ncbi:uncharacterized protein [Lepeophtheirus salmonis]|uniref:Uncharacterized protein n=1 Tax=Lepeophtheirus salmonis TaxID=72036 RepID=A0A0K2TJ86_LEPSM|nr:uncharacterized protein LOC121118864 [Lepeophtheirus salmonis]
MNIGQRSHNGLSSGSSSGLSLHHVVGPQNLNELKYVHEQAENTAIIYISTIIILYIFGLTVILFHHMNQIHGVWAWNCLDVWDELRPWSPPSTSNTVDLDDGTDAKQGIEIVIESAYDDSQTKPKKKWKHNSSCLFFFKSKEKCNMDNSNSHYNHNSESSCYHTKESREDSIISGSLKVKDTRGMSVVTILNDDHHRGRQSVQKSQVLETAL